jgi:hypothetical protein
LQKPDKGCPRENPSITPMPSGNPAAASAHDLISKYLPMPETVLYSVFQRSGHGSR